MNEPPKVKKAENPRDDRRAKALRENLKRRKAQARGRAEAKDERSTPRDSGGAARPGE
jgi:hypothetical protein